MAYENYQDAVEKMWDAFRKFHRAYMDSLEEMISNKSTDPALSGRAAVKQRDEIADAYAGLNSAIAKHLRNIKGHALRASSGEQVASELLKMAKQLMSRDRSITIRIIIDETEENALVNFDGDEASAYVDVDKFERSATRLVNDFQKKMEKALDDAAVE